MINLIPNQDKKKTAKDFYFRLITLCFVALGICVLIASISILPAYFLASTKKSLADEKLEVQKKQVVPDLDQQSLTNIKNLNNKLTIIENAEKNKFLVSQKVIQEIISQKMPDIKISKISYSNDPINGKVINVVGVAPSRDRLLLFNQTLEADNNFKSVDLPISNFLKGTNIQFNLVLIAS